MNTVNRQSGVGWIKYIDFMILDISALQVAFVNNMMDNPGGLEGCILALFTVAIVGPMIYV